MPANGFASARHPLPRSSLPCKEAALDKDQEVAARAKLALQADVHHRIMVKMGLIESDETESPANAIQDSIDDESRI